MDGTLRRSEVAGRFFPGDADGLAQKVAALLDEARAVFAPVPSRPLAVISPHAGYAYSGVLTAAALGVGAAWRPARIAILSPAHRHAFEGLALPSQPGYALPGFALAIDRGACDGLVTAGLALVLDAAFDLEHGIETQLPFLNALHPGVPVVPLVIGAATPAQVAAVVDHLAAAPGDTLFVLSSDLSHFLTDAEAKTRDAATAKKIETGDWQDLTGQDACGARAIAGFLVSRRGRGARALRLGMMNSAAKTGDRSRVVGYGAWSLHAPGDATLGKPHRAALLRVARQALEQRTATGSPPEAAATGVSPRLLGHAASFVTLEAAGRLRGCIGSLAPRAPLVRDVSDNAVKAGFSDPRFTPVTADELAAIRIKVSVLSRPAPLDFDGEEAARAALVPGETGVILTDGRHRGVFLPQVWDSLPDSRAFLDGLKRKAGLPADHWSAGLRLDLFRGESFGEDG